VPLKKNLYIVLEVRSPRLMNFAMPMQIIFFEVIKKISIYCVGGEEPETHELCCANADFFFLK
jgi:hypothetical protein